jgi:hypothetical protein
MAAEPRPSSWDILTAYIQEGYRAWQARDKASSQAVEDRLGLSLHEGLDWHRELERQNLIIMHDIISAASSPYRLSPRGLAFAERLPDLQRLVTQQTAAILASGATADEKRQAGVSIRDELFKAAISQGVTVAIQNAPAMWNTVRTIYGWLPPSWKEGI